MKAHDIRAVLNAAPKLTLTANTTAEEAAVAFPQLASFDKGWVTVGRFSGQTPWECHPESDELLHVLDGELEVTLLTEEESVQVTVAAGSVFVVPRGLWHRQLARSTVTLFAALAADHGPVSFAEDPRQEG
jgi:mannose-6-phosphate isomerase-like protein (cupin superfamily)